MTPLPMLFAALIVLAICGCDRSDTELARQALSNQAAQNQAMADLQREVAAGAREFTVADANARRQSIELHQQIQAERSELSTGWSDLHAQRRSDVLSLRTDSFLSALVKGGGATAAALLALAIVRTVMNSRGSEDADLADLILDMCETPEHSSARSIQVQTCTPPTIMRLASNIPEEP